MASIDELAEHFRNAGREHWHRSPMYAHLNTCIAESPDVVELLTAAPEEQQLPVLLLASVHSIVLAEPDLELAAWYPTTTTAPLTSDVFPAFERLCSDRADELRQLVATHTVQTNEVGRCAFLLPALPDVGASPLALIDVGTSAGLNLGLADYAYRYDPGGRLGGPSDVALECAVRGSVDLPAQVPAIVDRIGIDRNPIDPTDPDAARWLLACVWPDQADRFVRLRAALDVARAHPPRLIAGDAVASLRHVVDLVDGPGHVVVMNSWVLNYLPEPRRMEYVAEIDAIGRERDITWVYAESPGLCPGVPFPAELQGVHTTAVMRVSWRDGQRSVELIGTAHPHGYWLHGPGA